MLLELAATFIALLLFPEQTITAQQTTSPSHNHRQDHQNADATGWPDLRFNFTLKRSSMEIYGQSEFSMLASPVVSVDNAEVLYDVFAQFREDQTLYNYSEVHGIAYLSTSSGSNKLSAPSVKCVNLDSGKIPSINAIVSGISEAVLVSNVSGSASDAIECATGNLFKAVINDISFALCSFGSSGLKLHGSDMDISVEYQESHVKIDDPSLSGSIRGQCTTTAFSSNVTAVGKALLTGCPINVSDIRKLRAAIDFPWEDSCSCKSKPRPCIFVHGLGIKKEHTKNRDRFYYWGSLKGHAPCCSSMEYTYLNTSGNPWTSDKLQQKVCDRALAVSETSSNSTISDTIVVTHSMGNLMLAGAIANGKCNLASSSTWVGLAGPMKGSACSDYVQDSCAGKRGGLLEAFAEVTGKCPPTTGLKSLPYQGGSYSSPELDAAYTMAQKAYRENVYAVMCSQSYYGVISLYQSIFWMLGKSVPHKSKRNDGMVEFDSCAGGFPESKFGVTYRDRFYKTRLNHLDMEFLGGDALLDESKMPVKWFECLL